MKTKQVTNFDSYESLKNWLIFSELKEKIEFINNQRRHTNL